MFVRRDRGETLDDDRERTRRLVEDARERDEPGLRVWTPPPHVSFGRRDANDAYFERARTAAEDRGYPTTVRSAGGRAVAHTEGTLAIALAVPNDDRREGIQSRYDVALRALRSALDAVGVDAARGEPPDSFCPGIHSLQYEEGKIVGLAQRVRRDVAVLTAIVVVRDVGAVADVLGPVYDALDVPFDLESVGSVAENAGPVDGRRVGDAIVTAVDDHLDR